MVIFIPGDCPKETKLSENNEKPALQKADTE
jgi:hypothetical protein